jgi:hypothetical protein
MEKRATRKGGGASMTKELTLQDLYELMQYDNYEFQTQDVKTALLMLRKRMDKESKELNTGEPVAYRWQWDDGLEWHYGSYHTDRDYFRLEPLYIHPVKEPVIAEAGDKFCDANCVWTDHHPDCQIEKAVRK